MEEVALKQILKYMNQKCLFYEYQSGFRKFHSTTTCTLDLINNIITAIDEDEFAILVILDFSCAFDSIVHDNLLRKLQTQFDFHLNAIKWLCSYLNERKQAVKFGSSQSSTIDLCPTRFYIWTSTVLHVHK